jgi:recombination protein RecA
MPRKSKKPPRKPERAPKRSSKKQLSQPKIPKIKKDPLKEYAMALKRDGIVEVLRLSDDCLASVPLHFSTQSLELDRLLNNRGIPSGRVTEFFGPPHIGKSTLLDHLFAEAQRIGGVAALIDAEGARDSTYSRNIGVDLDKIQYIEFDRSNLCVETVMEVIYNTVDFWRINYPDKPVVIGFDALAGTPTRAELEGTLEKKDQPGHVAKIMRKACRKMPAKIGGTKIAVIICNHEYEKIPKPGQQFGKKKDTYGGDGLRHLSSIRLSLFNRGMITGTGGAVIGREVGVRLIKNRLGNPYGETTMAILSGVGVDNVWSIHKRFTQMGIIATSGKSSWGKLELDGEEIKFQGWTGLLQKCREDSSLFNKLVGIYQSMG